MPRLARRFAARFAELRKEKGLNGAQLARRAGCVRSTVFFIEAARMLPNVELLWRFAKVLSCDLVDFVTFPTANRRHDLIELSRHATDDALDRAARILDPKAPPLGSATNRTLLRRFAARFVALREEQALSGPDLARLVDCDRSTIFRVSSARHLPNIELLSRCAEVLACDLVDFLTFPETSPRDRLIELSRHARNRALDHAAQALADEAARATAERTAR